jgi:hypothetical protein
MLLLMLRAQWLTLKQDSMNAPSGLHIGSSPMFKRMFVNIESRPITHSVRLQMQ